MSACSRQEAEVLSAAAAIDSTARRQTRKKDELASCLAVSAGLQAEVAAAVYLENFVMLVMLLAVLESIL